MEIIKNMFGNKKLLKRSIELIGLQNELINILAVEITQLTDAYNKQTGDFWTSENLSKVKSIRQKIESYKVIS